jgi:hypothetical protein
MLVPEHSRRLFVARCSCGWRSAPVATAGMAGARFDVHLTEVEPDPPATT